MAEPRSDIVEALEPVVEALDALAVRYRVGGSVASSALGVPRSTLAVDVACELRSHHIDALVARLIGAYYVDADMVRDAITRESCFNGRDRSRMFRSSASSGGPWRSHQMRASSI